MPGTDSAPPYPEHWEADVVLTDGATAHLRPIRPDDADGLRRLHSRLSPETIYFRFFAPLPKLPDKDVARFTEVDHIDRIALVAEVGDEIVGVVRYDRVTPTDAEVAFSIEDAHQGRGLGSVFLEHVAAAARERGVQRFIATVLPSNRRMLGVFRDAGYVVKAEFEDGVVELSFDLAPTETSIAVMVAREHRAEARSIERLLRPGSVAVVGASRERRTIGQTVLRHLLDAGFTGPVYAVNRSADAVVGGPAYASVSEVPGPVDLAVVAVPVDEILPVVADCAAKGVLGLVVMSSGFAEQGEDGALRQLRLVRAARANGMRVVGPSSFGLLNTDPAVRLNASLSPQVPDRGRIGFFSQSGALGIALLANVVDRGLGLSTFVSAGTRADVSGNDLLQYWEDDPATDVVLLYLESLGNPRKFGRLARRVGRVKPVVVVRSGRSLRGGPAGVRRSRPSTLPLAAVDAMFQQAGVVRAETIHQMFDVAALFAHQPLPAGRRVAVVGNSDSLGVLAADACLEAGLAVVGDPVDLGTEATAAEYARALGQVFADPDVDSVVAVFIPPLETADEDVARVLAAQAHGSPKTVVSTFLGMRGVPAQLAAPGGAGSVPSYPTPEDAVRALALAVSYAEWRASPAGTPVRPDGVDLRRAHALVGSVLQEAPDGRDLRDDETAELLACVGVAVEPVRAVSAVDEAVAAAAELGYPVVLKSRAPHLQHRAELGGVRLDLADEEDLRTAWASLAATVGPGDLVVQRMVPPGVACVAGSTEDPLFGPVVWFGVGGVASELFDDTAYRAAPLTDVDAAEMVRTVRAAPLLLGHRGSAPVDLAALEDLLVRVSTLADALPEVAELELQPVLAAAAGRTVLVASARLSPPLVRVDRGPRALSG